MFKTRTEKIFSIYIRTKNGFVSLFGAFLRQQLKNNEKGGKSWKFLRLRGFILISCYFAELSRSGACWKVSKSVIEGFKGIHVRLLSF
jgi:hypothetical protein